MEQEIRRALETEALAYEPPEDLARRTIEVARDLDEPTFAESRRARRDARRMRHRVRGYPKWVYAGAAAVLIVAAFGIGRTFSPPQTKDRGPVTRQLGIPAPAALGLQGATDSSSQGLAFGQGEVEQAPIATAPKVVRTAEIEIRLAERGFDRAWSRAQQIAGRFGGFVTNSSAEETDGRVGRGSLTMRVPSTQMDAATAEFRRLGSLVRQTSSATDVGAQIVDFDARLRARQAHELQLLELLKRTGSLSETLEVRSRLDQVRQEIEQMKAQRDNLQGQVDLATISATLYEPDGEPPDTSGALGRLAQGWRLAGEAAVTVAGGILVAGGFVLPLVAMALLAWFVTRLVRRR